MRKTKGWQILKSENGRLIGAPLNSISKIIHILLCALFIGGLSHRAFSAPPFITDDAEPEEYKHSEIYVFSNLDKSAINIETLLPGLVLKYGLAPNLEVSTTVGLLANTGNQNEANAYGYNDMELELTYAFVNETKYLPQVAIIPTIFLPTGNAKRQLGNGRVWEQLGLSIEKSWGSWTSYGEGGYGYNSVTDMKPFCFGGVVLEYQINAQLMIGGEIYTQGAEEEIQTEGSTILNIGASYNLEKDIALLFSMGHSLIGQANLVSYIGIDISL